MKSKGLEVFAAALLLAGCSKEPEPSLPPVQPVEAPKPVESADPKAPDKFRARFVTSKGEFIIEVNREWSPRGADRFYTLVKSGFFDDVRFFRVVQGFMAQFGLSGDPAVSEKWREATLPDDPVKQSNTRGMVTYAKTDAPNSRTTQIFINYGNNSWLDRDGFSPFGKVVEGMEVGDALHSGYGDAAPRGRGPDQGRIQKEGNAYLAREFDQLDFVKTARILE